MNELIITLLGLGGAAIVVVAVLAVRGAMRLYDYAGYVVDDPDSYDLNQ
jgi:hypothetical protein